MKKIVFFGNLKINSGTILTLSLATRRFRHTPIRDKRPKASISYKLILIFLCIIFAVNLNAQTTYYSLSTGDWGTPPNDKWSTASCGGAGAGDDYPGKSSTTDNAVICSGTTITIDINNLTITDLTVESGAVLNLSNANNFTVLGNLVVNGTVMGSRDLYLSGGGTTIDGTGYIDINDPSSKDLVINGNVSVLSSANLTITEDINIASGVTVTNNGTITVNTDILGADATSTWTNAANSTLKIGNALLNSTAGTLNASASGNTIEYISSTDQDIMNPSSSTYYNLTISGGGIKYLKANTIIDGNLTINSGTFDCDVTNNYTIDVKGSWNNSGTFNEQQGTVTFNGTSDQSFSNSSNETFYNLTTNKSSGTLIL
ncbi:MAG: hypothetical protein U9Q98_02145, partial [Bacteroidota bacterium]|nr:hypothetical protein [Bacteroidota bacterium]